jgi:thiol:disulfide interchange protein
MTFANPDFAEVHSLSVSSLSAPLIRQIQHAISIAYSAGEMRRLAALVAVCLCLARVPGQTQEAVPSALNWLPWSQDVFAQAKAEHRFVLLDLEAVWCHWCHVMDVTTYRNPKVIALAPLQVLDCEGRSGFTPRSVQSL